MILSKPPDPLYQFSECLLIHRDAPSGFGIRRSFNSD